MKYYIRGGVGDILQSLWFIKNYPQKEYIVHTHYKKAKEIFAHFGALNAHFYEFDDLESHNAQVDFIKEDHAKESQKDIADVPRAFYSDFDFGKDADQAATNLIESFAEKKDIIGIHPFRSNFAQSVYDDFKLPAKELPIEISKNIIDKNNNYLLFGSKNELLQYGISEDKNIKFVCFDNIIDSLATVKYCKTLIGLDSCFKSMSSMQRINTICIIGNFHDPTRDQMFINQYEQDGVLKVFRTKNIKDDQSKIISFFQNEIKNLSS